MTLFICGVFRAKILDIEKCLEVVATLKANGCLGEVSLLDNLIKTITLDHKHREQGEEDRNTKAKGQNGPEKCEHKLAEKC